MEQLERRPRTGSAGKDRKLCRGGGELVAHSSEFPYPHGSSAVVTSPYR